MLKRAVRAFSSPAARWLTAGVGLALVALLLRNAGLHTVAETLARAAPVFPFILVLEAAIIVCTMCALRLLYREDRHRLPVGALIRAGLIGYSVAGLLPAGRVAAESTRAALLARYSTRARAAVAGARLQGLVLLAVSAVSVPAALAMYLSIGASTPTFLIAGNALLTFVLGAGILLAGRHSSLGAWLGRLVPRAQSFGDEFDRHFTSQGWLPGRAFAWECLGRVVQVTQNGLLVLAVGGKLGLIPALCSEALHLVGASLGDLVPGQIGATEVNFRLSAHALSLTPVDALSIALLAHLAQLFWVAVGLLVPLFSARHPLTTESTVSG